jgi:transcriptional regulator with XRE-family HTH domain
MEKVDRSVLSENIRKYRKLKNLTQIQLAEKSGLSKRMVAYYETNISNPPINNLLAIAKALNVSIYALIGEKQPRSTIELFEDIDMRTLKKILLIKKLPKKDRFTIYNMIGSLLKTNTIN